MTRATIDVNVLLSALIGALGPSRQVVRAWQAERFTHVTSDHIIATFEAKLATPVLVARFPFLPAAGRALLPVLRTQTTMTPLLPSAIVPVTGDAEDDGVLATAKLGAADYLVSGDRGLLTLGTHEGVAIVRPRRFMELLDQEG
jgi:putative PIN family toxin of toxin-antitoxin system